MSRYTAKARVEVVLAIRAIVDEERNTPSFSRAERLDELWHELQNKLGVWEREILMEAQRNANDA